MAPSTKAEAQFFLTILLNVKGSLDVNWVAVAKQTNRSSANSAQIRFGQIKKKLLAESSSQTQNSRKRAVLSEERPVGKHTVVASRFKVTKSSARKGKVTKERIDNVSEAFKREIKEEEAVYDDERYRNFRETF